MHEPLLSNTDRVKNNISTNTISNNNSNEVRIRSILDTEVLVVSSTCLTSKTAYLNSLAIYLVLHFMAETSLQFQIEVVETFDSHKNGKCPYEVQSYGENVGFSSISGRFTLNSIWTKSILIVYHNYIFIIILLFQVCNVLTGRRVIDIQFFFLIN